MIEKINCYDLQEVISLHRDFNLGDGYYIRYVENECIWKVGVELVNDEANIRFPFLYSDYGRDYSDLMVFGGIFQRMAYDINERIAHLNDNNHIMLGADYLIGRLVERQDLYELFDGGFDFEVGDGFYLRYVSMSDYIGDRGFELYSENNDYSRLFLFDDYVNFSSHLFQYGGYFDRMAIEINREIYELELKGEIDY